MKGFIKLTQGAQATDLGYIKASEIVYVGAPLKMSNTSPKTQIVLSNGITFDSDTETADEIIAKITEALA